MSDSHWFQYMLLLIGWFLGVANTLVVDEVRQLFRTQRLKKAIFAELREYKYMVRLVAALLCLKLGEFDETARERYLNNLDEYDGPELSNDQREMLKRLRHIDKSELDAFNQMQRKQALKQKKRSSLRQYNLSFLASHLDSIILFKPDFQRRLYRIYERSRIINQNVDEYHFFFRKTFDPDSYEVNDEALNANMDDKLRMLIGLYSDIADHIDRLVVE